MWWNSSGRQLVLKTLNLAPEIYITQETKWHPLCCYHDSSFAAGPVLIKNEIPSFCLNQGSSSPNNLTRTVVTIIMGTISVPSRTISPTSKGCKWGSLVSERKRLQPRVLSWQQHNRCNFFCTTHFWYQGCRTLFWLIFLEIIFCHCFIVLVALHITASLS